MLRPVLFVLALLVAALTAVLAPAGARAAVHVPGEVVVRFAGETRPEVRQVSDVDATIKRLRARPDVVYAVRNAVASVSAFMPDDPGRTSTPGGWAKLQWNFAGTWGVGAPQAWQHLIDVRRPGGKGVVVAVLDTGVAYRARGRYLKSPDLQTFRFIRGYDFVDDDPYPYDRNGHGTHVASTINEATDNGVGLTGLAYGATILPVRVLDDAGEGDASKIAEGVRYAVRRGAQVINLSLEFSVDVRAGDIPQLLEAVRYAKRRGVLVVGASGNEGYPTVAYPARSDSVLSVGATTERGCLADYSNGGRGLDLVAPGGGGDSDLGLSPACKPDSRPGRDIYQVTLEGEGRRRFGIPSGYEGTSMAAPHVSAAAALVIASGVLGSDPTPAAIERHLERTAKDLGEPGYDSAHGAGLLDAAAATAPATP